MISKKVELLVGFFVALGIAALMFLALNVASSGMSGSGETYNLYAKFQNIGGLKVRSSIKVGGVVIGRVEEIKLDTEDYAPVAKLAIDAKYNNFPDTSSLSILTSGLLGEQYLGLEPGFIDETVGILGEGDFIEDTKSALVLEELIGQFLFSQGNE
ncbi:outer membrane lipid asymmetry maintenance protein MlaD [Psychrosphaera sp. F3M07]|jgi:phospholipid/cholesterol/gamma-HCH transport system substrate-binding protein|uniref:Outer membrane lipid asymmetry maintenance protein MlaD n=1 Tax=Psychrosphaera aquimarina TaxID=2044854 RepID=A0ABU3R2R1_9GAMM|nr:MULTISPECIES: outer membrane lipid asymmetry maintenance protein MlaD [Psychrosphaera]MBU2919191.1 outer membrane lipid asymmetry maintenance protein MlaD [Psychrosphaera sp. F3M07]MDU0113968.1 outer membrane lipid asymmetry maintenance protein MlaD [Psychrosphaera aquimarina]